MFKKKKYIILFNILLLLVTLVLLKIFPKENKVFYNVGGNSIIEDDMIMALYHKYNPENGLKFQIIGSDIMKNDSYALYYKKNRLLFNEFPNDIKNYILLDTINYKSENYNENKKCYFYSLEEYEHLYTKNFDNIDYLSFLDTDGFIVENNSLCIMDLEKKDDYKHTLDTYLIDAWYEDGKIIILEKVAFIKIDNDVIRFYNDYHMNNEIYKLNIDDINKNFINSYNLVSDILLLNIDKFNTYKYTYIKIKENYFFDRVELIDNAM